MKLEIETENLFGYFRYLNPKEKINAFIFVAIIQVKDIIKVSM